jgi:hypothetical protein
MPCTRRHRAAASPAPLHPSADPNTSLSRAVPSSPFSPAPIHSTDTDPTFSINHRLQFRPVLSTIWSIFTEKLNLQFSVVDVAQQKSSIPVLGSIFVSFVSMFRISRSLVINFQRAAITVHRLVWHRCNISSWVIYLLFFRFLVYVGSFLCQFISSLYDVHFCPIYTEPI